MVDYYLAGDEIKNIAEKLIARYHSELANCKIVYVMREKCSKKGGQKVYGSVKKVSPLYQAAMGVKKADFIIEIGQDGWFEDLTNPGQGEALIDSLLERIQWDEPEDGKKEGKFFIAEPDFQEFTNILKRWGMWHPSLREMEDFELPKTPMLELLEELGDQNPPSKAAV